MRRVFDSVNAWLEPLPCLRHARELRALPPLASPTSRGRRSRLRSAPQAHVVRFNLGERRHGIARTAPMAITERPMSHAVSSTVFLPVTLQFRSSPPHRRRSGASQPTVLLGPTGRLNLLFLVVPAPMREARGHHAHTGTRPPCHALRRRHQTNFLQDVQHPRAQAFRASSKSHLSRMPHPASGRGTLLPQVRHPNPP